jgi:hypothetical protein
MKLKERELRLDQTQAIEWMTPKDEAFLILGVGFGKTICTLTTVRNIRREHPDWRVLVVSTKNIIDHTWGTEIKDWEHTQHLTYAAACGSKKKREAAIHARTDVLGVSFENLTWFYDQVDKDPSLLPEILVIDESSKMKDPSAKRVKRHAGFRKRGDPRSMNRGYIHQFKKRFALSATPAPEGFLGLWSQEACISMDRRLGANITEFRGRYCFAVWNGFANTYKVHAEGEERIKAALKPISYVAESDKYMDLPEPIHNEISVPWSVSARDEYETMANEFILELEGRLNEMGADPKQWQDDIFQISKVLAPNAAVVMSKLRQACSGFFYDAEGNTLDSSDPTAKLDAFEKYLERTGEAPVVCFTQFTAEQKALSVRFPEAQVGLPKSLDPWNAGDIPLMILHPRSAGHGVNLQSQHLAAWYSLPFSFEEWHQGNGRFHRTGQRNQVSITRFTRPNSIDRQVWSKLMGKGAKLNEFIEGVRG